MVKNLFVSTVVSLKYTSSNPLLLNYFNNCILSICLYHANTQYLLVVMSYSYTYIYIYVCVSSPMFVISQRKEEGKGKEAVLGDYLS